MFLVYCGVADDIELFGMGFWGGGFPSLYEPLWLVYQFHLLYDTVMMVLLTVG